MLDTIECSFPIFIPREKTVGWGVITDPTNKYRNFCWCDYEGVHFEYYYNQFKNKMPCPHLKMSFSAASFQNGCNAFRYEFKKGKRVINRLEKILFDLTSQTVSLKDITSFSRIDINRDTVCETKNEQNEIFSFYKKIRGRKGMKRKLYDSGLALGNKAVRLSFYFKDKDPNLPEKIREEMQPTCRTEFQLREYRIKKYYSRNISLYDLLLSEAETVDVWNSMIKEFSIDGRICNQKNIKEEAIKIYNNRKKVLEQKLNELKEVNRTDDEKLVRLTDKSYCVVKEMSDAGICPYSCEVPLTLQAELPIGKRKANSITYDIVFWIVLNSQIVYRRIEAIDSS